MKRKLLSMLLVVTMLGTMAVGCGGSGEEAAPAEDAATEETADDTAPAEGGKTIGLSVDSSFGSRIAETDAIKEKAAEMGYEVTEVVAEGDATLQNSQIETLVNQGVDAIIVCAVNDSTIETALLKADAKDIPVIAFDRNLDKIESMDIYYAGTDSVADGIECGKAMGEALKDQGKVKILELIGSLDDPNGVDRQVGFEQGIFEVLGEENVELIEGPTNWDGQTAQEATQNAFQANDDIVGVYAPADFFFPLIQEVLVSEGKAFNVGEEGHVFVNGVNGDQPGYEAVVAGTADGFLVVDQAAIGYKAVELVDQVLAGESVDAKNLIPGIYYTKENAEANKDKIWGANVE